MNQYTRFESTERTAALKEELAAYLDQHIGMSFQQAAAPFRMTEGQVLAAAVGERVVRLTCNRAELLYDLANLGPVCAVTGNDCAVHRKRIDYRRLRKVADHVQVVDRNLALDLYHGHWHYGFAVREATPRGMRESLRFFDAHGRAVHSIEKIDATNSFAYRTFIATHRAVDQSGRRLEAQAERKPEADSRGEDGGGTRRLPVARFRELVQTLSDLDLEIGLAVRSPGAMQTYRGTPQSIRSDGSWLEVRDGDFSLELNDAGCAHARMLGRTAAVELHGPAGDIVATISGPAAHNRPQAEVWRELLAALTALKPTGG